MAREYATEVATEDVAPAETTSTREYAPAPKMTFGDVVERATALPKAVIQGVGRLTGQSMTTEPTEPIQRSYGEQGTNVAAATGLGAGMGYILPKALQMVPNPAIQTAGRAMELIPPSQRMLGGGFGGGLSSLAGQTAETYGAPTAVKLPLEVLSAGIGDIVGQKLTTAASNLAKAAYYGGRGNLPLATSYFTGAFGQPMEERLAAATARQRQIFGKPSPETVAGETTDKFQREVQDTLKKQYGYGKTTDVYAPQTGTEVMVPGTDMRVPAKGIQPATLKPTGETVTKSLPKDTFGNEVPVSQALREDFYNGVNQIITKVAPEQRFSTSPEYVKFIADLEPLVAKGSAAGGISRGDFNSLKQALGTDMGSIASRQEYAQTVDNLIRKWQGKPNQTGVGAIDADVAKNIRQKLRDNFGLWSERNGLGTPEKNYRAAYTAEKTAQAKDNIPYVISHYGDKPQADKMALQISKDPELKAELNKALRQQLANTPTEKLVEEFKRIDKLVVRAGLSNPQEMAQYRRLVSQIDAIKKQGKDATPYLERLKAGVIRSAAIAGAAQIPSEVSKLQGQ
jgi:hypothetical protein